jgi:3-oxoacyl-(acyl-carrier-protein) synthase
MDKASSTRFSDPLVLTGLGTFRETPGKSATEVDSKDFKDFSRLLKNPKMKKFMGKQDKIAVLAVSHTLKQAQIPPSAFKDKTGIFLTVGYIPFEQKDIEPLTRASQSEGRFDMELFSTKGMASVHPLLTFRCLPNMPIFHISWNFEIQGSSFMTHPGPGQFYLALEQAIHALESQQIDYALVGGVADQNNFLVQHHFRRLQFPQAEALVDAGGFLCLERLSSAQERKARILWELCSWEIQYQPFDPFQERFAYTESLSSEQETLKGEAFGYLGPASFPILLAQFSTSTTALRVTHQLKTLDGLSTSSVWSRALPAERS